MAFMDKSSDELHSQPDAAFGLMDEAREQLKEARGPEAVLAGHDAYETAKERLDKAVSEFVERFRFPRSNP
jgi:hypothetical protein